MANHGPVGEKILVVEDADSLREVLTSILQTEGFVVDACPDAETALKHLAKDNYSCILSDFKLPGKDGIALLKETRALSTAVPFLIMTAYGSIEIAVEAMKHGANDFITKPFEPSFLCSTIREVIAHRRIVDRTLSRGLRRPRRFLTGHPDAKKMLQQAQRAARVDSSILLLGESGTGKELVARFIHEHSPRADKSFVAVNCAAMPPDLLESEFFGHTAGAFTGATQDRPGLFQVVAEGTLFLDEIGDMPPSLQVKLLRVLQEREIRPIGSSKTIKVNPRVIAATNQNIEEALRSRRLREDLYYRLAVVTLEIPALRHRPCDVDLLTNYYIEYFCHVLGKTEVRIDDSAREVLHAHPWPGNARELENVIERAVVLCDQTILPEHLGIKPLLDFDALAETAASLPDIANLAARQAEIETITRALQRTSGNKTRAAKLLGVSYKTLLTKVKEYSLAGATEAP